MRTSRFEQRKINVLDQLKWIADHNYEGYDRPTRQSNGTVAVNKADINRLLNTVDQLWSYAHWNGRPQMILDTDDLQIKLEAIVDSICHGSKNEYHVDWEVSAEIEFELAKSQIESAIIEPVTTWIHRVG